MRQSGVWRWVLLLWLACGGLGAVAGEAEWKAHMQAGQAAYGKGDCRSATPRFEAALKEAEVTFGHEHANTATTLDDLAFLYQAQGRHACQSISGFLGAGSRSPVATRRRRVGRTSRCGRLPQ